MSDIAIRVGNLSKQYRIGGPQAHYKTIRELLVGAVQAPFRRLKIIADFGLRIANREAGNPQFEIRFLSRITEPTERYTEIHGWVGSLSGGE